MDDLEIYYKIQRFKRRKYYEQSSEVLNLRKMQKEKICTHTNLQMNNLKK